MRKLLINHLYPASITVFRSIVGALLYFFAVAGTHAQSTVQGGAYTFSLQQAVDYALQNQRNVKNAQLDEQIAGNRVKEITGMGLPQVNGSLDVKDFIVIPTTVIPAQAFNPAAPADAYVPVQFGIQYSSTAGIDFSQLVFSSDYILGLKASSTYLELAKKSAQRSRIETATAVTKAYYSVLLNDERMKLIEANILRLKKLADDTKALNNNGMVEKLDVDRITVAYNNLLAEKDKIQRLMELGNALLKFQVGLPQATVLTLSDKLADVKFESPSLSDSPGYSNRVEYTLFESQQTMARLQLRKDQLSFLPTIVVFGSFSYNAFRSKFDFLDTDQKWYKTSLIGASMKVPVFSGGQKHFKIQQSRLALQKADNDMEFIKQSIDLERASSKAGLLNATASLDMQKKNIELAEEIFKVAKLKYDQGIGSALEVMNAETSLKEAQANYFNALYDALVAKVDFEKANGTIVK